MAKTVIPTGQAILLARPGTKIHEPMWGLLALRPPRSLIRITPRGAPGIFSKTIRFPLAPDRMKEAGGFRVGAVEIPRLCDTCRVTCETVP